MQDELTQVTASIDGPRVSSPDPRTHPRPNALTGPLYILTKKQDQVRVTLSTQRPETTAFCGNLSKSATSPTAHLARCIPTALLSGATSAQWKVDASLRRNVR